MGVFILTLSCDFETRSPVDLKAAGVYTYAAHPETDIWCLAWALDDDEPAVWLPGTPLPAVLLAHVAAGGECRAWNSMFERIIWRDIMVPRYNAPPIADSQWVDTAAEAAAMALPRSLDGAAAACHVSQQKDDAGYRLMLRMSKPRSKPDERPIRWWDEPEKLAALYAYCQQDVRTERAVARAVRRLIPREREIYLLDQRINDRGVRIDVPLVHAAIDIADTALTRADAILQGVTGGAIDSVMQAAELTAWIRTQGVEASGISKPVLKELMDGPLPEPVREALQLRSDAGRTSVAKLTSMLAVVGGTDRARGLALYHGAGTGRWSGKLLQPQNFPRGEVPEVEQYIPEVVARDYDLLAQFYHPTIIVSSLLRSMLIAAPEQELIAGDFSAIEARVLNWLAGQEDVLASFRAYDAGDKTKDPYVLMAARMGPSVGRQTGKAAELGCGFGMGDEKFVAAAWKVYQVRVSPEEAKGAVLAYRESHPLVKQLWADVENACLDAIRWPGSVRTINPHLRAVVAGAYLYLALPSGRTLAYAAPKIEDRITPWGAVKDSVTFMGTEPFGAKRWGRMSTYGGSLVENIVQGVARDLLADGMVRLEAAGYPPVLHVHDEVVAEVPLGFGSQDEFNRLLATCPAWAHGCPIAVEGWRGARYRK